MILPLYLRVLKQWCEAKHTGWFGEFWHEIIADYLQPSLGLEEGVSEAAW